MLVRGRSVQEGGRYRGFGYDGKALHWGSQEVTVDIPEEAFEQCQHDPVVIVTRVDQPPAETKIDPLPMETTVDLPHPEPSKTKIDHTPTETHRSKK